MTNSGFAITKYPDSVEIYRKLDLLLSQPILPLKPEVLDKYLKWFDDKCPNSKELIGKAKEVIPGGVQHNLAFNYPFPLVFTKAEGAYLQDIDGNRYIDFLQAGGPTVLGSNPPVVRDKVLELLIPVDHLPDSSTNTNTSWPNSSVHGFQRWISTALWAAAPKP